VDVAFLKTADCKLAKFSLRRNATDSKSVTINGLELFLDSRLSIGASHAGTGLRHYEDEPITVDFYAEGMEIDFMAQFEKQISKE
jgi:hypothetical protein